MHSERLLHGADGSRVRIPYHQGRVRDPKAVRRLFAGLHTRRICPPFLHLGAHSGRTPYTYCTKTVRRLGVSPLPYRVKMPEDLVLTVCDVNLYAISKSGRSSKVAIVAAGDRITCGRNQREFDIDFDARTLSRVS